MPLRASWTQSHIYDFNLVMECCYTYLTLWLGRLNNNRFVMNSTIPMATWWHVGIYSVCMYYGPVVGQELFLERKVIICGDSRALFQYLCFNILNGCITVHQQWPVKGSKQLPCLLLTLKASLNLLDNMDQEQLAQLPGPVAEPSSVLGPTQK